MAAQRVTRKLKVRGNWKFPIDMLRRDRCTPDTEEDANIISRSLDSLCEPGKWEVTVRRQIEKREPLSNTWTIERWESFGCHVAIEDEWSENG